MIEMLEGNAFHLATDGTSYVICITDTGHAEHIYYGKKLRDVRASLTAIREKRYMVQRSAVPVNEDNAEIDLNDTLLEFSSEGKGDYRIPLIAASWGESGERTIDLRFREAKQGKGVKLALTSLPIAKDRKDEAETLELVFDDRKSGMRMTLAYTVFPSLDTITRRTIVENRGVSRITLRAVASAQLDFRSSDMKVTSITGKWLREAEAIERRIESGTIISESRRDRSSAEANPGFMLTDGRGGCYICNLIYSGAHRASFSLTSDGMTHIVWGINPDLFSWDLQKGSRFESPEAVMAYSEDGQAEASARMHAFIRSSICRGEWAERMRPLMLNTWESVYYNASEDKILEMAKGAKGIGLEGVIVGDGWFGARRSERTSLGDWHVNTMKFPSGLFSLAQGIHRLGLLFGLWFEPECVSDRSELYKTHPEWIIGRSAEENAGRAGKEILNLTLPAVQDWMIETLSSTIDRCRIDYIVWDMTRSYSDIFSQMGAWDGGEFLHKYILGLYTVLGALGHRFPSLYISTAASGGARFDLGMLSFSTSALISDDTDPMDRASMLAGISMLYPLSAIETTVSPSPNAITRRIVDRDTRFNIGAFGVLSYAIDTAELSRVEKTAFKAQIEFYKGYRMLLQFGRIRVQEKGNRTIWTVSNKDRSVILMLYLQRELKPNSDEEKLFVLDADEGYDYRIFARSHILSGQEAISYPQESECYTVPGDALRWGGISLVEQVSGNGYREGMRMLGDCSSRLYIIRRIED